MDLPPYKKGQADIRRGRKPYVDRKALVQDWQAEMQGKPPFAHPDYEEYQNRILMEDFAWFKKFLEEKPEPGPIKDFKGNSYKGLDEYLMRKR